jgi:hypothetical protein
MCSVSTGFVGQIMPILHILCCNGCLLTWAVVSLTTAKFKPLIFSLEPARSRSRSLLPATRRHTHTPASGPAGTHGQPANQSINQSYIATDCRSISKSWCLAPSGAHDQIFITAWQLRSCFCGAPLWREDGSVFCICYWPSPAQFFSGPSPLELATIFYCLSFARPVFTAYYIGSARTT